jgi:hypothetical protein
VAGVTFSAGESVDILTVEVAISARHLQVPPDRFGEVRRFFGEFFLPQLLAGIFLHDSLLSEKTALTVQILTEVMKKSSFLHLMQVG